MSLPTLCGVTALDQWAVVSTHPFYGGCTFHDSADEATAEANRLIADTHQPDGEYGHCTIAVCRVWSQARVGAGW